MSTIDEIMDQVGKYAIAWTDACTCDMCDEHITHVNQLAVKLDLRNLISAALSDAERKGAEAMRAEIEAQEPAIVEAGELRIGFCYTQEAVWLKLSRNIPLGTKLYARPVPAQSVPDGWRLVPEEPTQEQWNAGVRAAREYMQETGGNSPAVVYRAMIAEAPEYKP